MKLAESGLPKGGGVGDGRNARLRRRVRQVPQGISADLIATCEGFTREHVDAFALESQRRAAAAIAAGRFAGSLVPVLDPDAPRQRVALDPATVDRETPLRQVAAGHWAAV